MPKNDDFTLALLTHDEVLAVNQNSTNNRQLFNTNHTVARAPTSSANSRRTPSRY